MLIEYVEQLKDWLTNSLAPICEADPGALAKYVVALVKKDKTLAELKDSCVDQLDVFLQSKTKPFVETLFEVLENKSYIVKEEPKPAPPVPDDVAPAAVEPGPDSEEPVPPSSDQLVTSTSKTDLSKKDDVKEEVPPGERRRRSPSPRYRSREDDRRRRNDDRRPYGRGYGRRRSISPRYRPGGRPRSRSPYRRRSPLRPVNRSRSPRPRIRGRSFSRSYSRSPPLRRSWSRSWSRERRRSRSPGGRVLNRSVSPRREVRARSPRGRSPLRRSVSPRGRSRSPRKRSWSPGRSRSPRKRSQGRSYSRSRSRSPIRRSRSRSPRKSGSKSPIRKVRRQSQDSRGPTPTQENGLVDSTNPGPTDSLSSISVLTNSSARFDSPSASRIRCRDFDEKGFCVRGDTCVYDHGTDPVVVENTIPQYPPGAPPHLLGPPPHGHPPHMNIPPPGFFPARMPGPPHMMRPPRPEPYNPEAPAISRQGMMPYWPGGPDTLHPGGKDGPPRPPTSNHLPVHARLGNRDLVNLTIKKEMKDEPEDEDEPSSSSTRTVIAPKEEPKVVSEPPPPGVTDTVRPSRPEMHARPQHRFHPYQQNPRYSGPRKGFDYNRVGGFRRPDTSNCSLEVRKVPTEFNNISKLNEHFGKFGTIVNLQVHYEGDPEGALVTYSRNEEALSCYKCSEPVFNNRFIKVFWHQKNKSDTSNTQEQSPTSTTSQSASGGSGEDHAPSLQSRLGPIPPASKMQLNNVTKRAQQAATAAAAADTAAPAAERQKVAYTSSMGINKAAAYSSAIAAAVAQRAKAQATLTSPTAVKAADFVSRMEKVKQIEVEKKEAALKKLEIQKQKQLLLEKQIEQQKKLIASLEKNKDMKEESKKVIMETLKTLTGSIEKLKAELGGRRLDSASTSGLKSPEQAKKEILDVELELMTKTTSGDDTAELKKKLAELTQVANSMGLLGRGRGRGSYVPRGRGSTTWVAKGVATPPVVGRGRGRGAFMGQKAGAVLSLDRRPKVLEVTGFDSEEKEEASSHLNALKEVEKVEFNMDIPSAIVSFKTRKDAEMGIHAGAKFKGKDLKFTWYVPKPDLSRSISTASGDTEDPEEIDEDALLAGVEDEEEDEDTRSWRR